MSLCYCLQVQGVWSTGYIPTGTRFGPLVGEVYAKDAVPNTANRKYFWRVGILCSVVGTSAGLIARFGKCMSVRFCSHMGGLYP